MEPIEKLSINVKDNNKRKKIILYIIIGLVVIFLIIIGLFGFTLNNVLGVLGLKSVKTGNTMDNLQQIVAPLDRPVNILVLGSDISYDGKGKKQAEGPARSDTMILAQADPVRNEVRALSIPRDSRVLIPGYKYYDKINAAFAFGGEKLARETVSNLTGVPVEHYVILKVSGLENLVNILGGVDLYVEKDMHYVDHTAGLNIDLKKGMQHLDGHQAHSYIRFRYDENVDIGRVQRQQKFIQAITEKFINPVNIFKIPDLVGEIRKNIISDLSTTELLRLGFFVRKLGRDQVRMVLIPGSFTRIGGVSYWYVDQYIAKIVIADFFPDSRFAMARASATPVPKDEKEIMRQRRRYRISLKDGALDMNFAHNIASLLKGKGWTVVSITKARELNDLSKLIVQTGISRNVPALKEALGFQPEVINSSTGDLYSDYTIVIGKDLVELFKSKQKN